MVNPSVAVNAFHVFCFVRIACNTHLRPISLLYIGFSIGVAFFAAYDDFVVDAIISYVCHVILRVWLLLLANTFRTCIRATVCRLSNENDPLFYFLMIFSSLSLTLIPFIKNITLFPSSLRPLRSPWIELHFISYLLRLSCHNIQNNTRTRIRYKSLR